MKKHKVIIRYAKTLFRIAKQKGVLEKVLRDMNMISNIFKSTEKLETFFTNPLIKDENILIPESPHVLPGIMAQEVCRLLVSWDYRIVSEKIRPNDFFKADEVLVTNSLIGALPALTLDGKAINCSKHLWQKINGKILKY